MGRRLNWSGILIALIGFFLTRFTVTLAIYEDPVRFLVVGFGPLVLGLGLAAFGVALAVADIEPSVVRTTALWCVIGVMSMLVLVILTLEGASSGGFPGLTEIRSRTYLSNFLIGGSVGGTLTGLYASGNRRKRGELQQHAHRLQVLNRLLRHDVLNALSVIRGYSALGRERAADADEMIEEYATAIEETIEEVKYLTRSSGQNESTDESVDVQSCIEESIRQVTERYPDAHISVETKTPGLTVRANERLERVFTHLLENGVAYSTSEEPSVEVTLRETTTSVRIAVRDEGPGLPADQQTLLETGEIHRHDDPGSGFGLNVVRLLVESYGGSIETDVRDGGSTITVVLPRATAEGTGLRASSGLVGVRPALPHLLITLVASVLAGVAYGLVSEQLGGSVAAIGVFYGIQNPVIGWFTHEFHSAVFAFMFAGLVSLAPVRYRDRLLTYMAIGVAWGLVLWVVAAGFIAPIWLRLLAIPAPIPNLTWRFLMTHLTWGLSLGLLTGLGYRYVLPWLYRVDEWFGDDRPAMETTAD